MPESRPLRLTPPAVKPSEKPSQAEQILRASARAGRRQAYLTHRSAVAAGAGPQKRFVLYGGTYAAKDVKPWKHEGAATVGVWVEVSAAGPVGATITVEGESLPADMPGGRTRVFSLDPNDTLQILFSDASIEANLIMATPEPAVPDYDD